jgi:hypothetical protein
MKIVKALAVVLAIVVVAAVIIGVYLLKNLDSIVKDTIERTGTDLTGTRVTLDTVKLDLASGRGALTGLVIANPAGFSGDYAFSLDSVVVAVEPASLTTPVIEIRELSIEGARLIAEQKGTSTNLDQILKNVEHTTGKSGEQPKTTDKEPSHVRLVVREFVFADTRATVISDLHGEASLKVPDVRRSNIGEPGGLSPDQLADELLHAVIEEVGKAVEKYLAGQAGKAAMDKLREETGISPEDAEAVTSGVKKLFKGE